jgi:hypothetical protein
MTNLQKGDKAKILCLDVYSTPHMAYLVGQEFEVVAVDDSDPDPYILVAEGEIHWGFLPSSLEKVEVDLDITSKHNRPMKTSRKLKVGSSYRPKQSIFGKGSVCPMIRLKGDWLREAGFVEGSNVQVEIENGSITIRPIK